MERPLFPSTLLSLLLLALMSLGLMSWAWTAPSCTIGDSSLWPNISYYIPFCPLAPGLHLFASCFNVNDLAQTLREVPQDTEVLCLQDALEPLKSLNTLSFHGSCLNCSQNVQLPISLGRLTLRHSCLTELKELQGLFPNLVSGSSPATSPSPRTSFLEVLDLSANLQLSRLGGRALHGLQLHSLRLDGTPLNALDLLGSDLLHLDSLYLVGTGAEKRPGNVTGYFELRALDLGRNQTQNLEDGDLLSFRSLELLSLHAMAFSYIPPIF
uniref:Uncharacterized protein n=1 Tax=Molossus molossus TaxID=27622 RepID=A0A7J8JXC2_MOLMO|nr:hypothetical protein HJG59_007988 [Molossus molossus]